MDLFILMKGPGTPASDRTSKVWTNAAGATACNIGLKALL